MRRSKNNARSRPSSPTSTNRRTPEPSSVRGLITNREQSIRNTETSSQVSEYTQRTNKTSGSLTTQDLDYVND